MNVELTERELVLVTRSVQEYKYRHDEEDEKYHELEALRSKLYMSVLRSRQQAAV